MAIYVHIWHSLMFTPFMIDNWNAIITYRQCCNVMSSDAIAFFIKCVQIKRVLFTTTSHLSCQLQLTSQSRIRHFVVGLLYLSKMKQKTEFTKSWFLTMCMLYLCLFTRFLISFAYASRVNALLTRVHASFGALSRRMRTHTLTRQTRGHDGHDTGFKPVVSRENSCQNFPRK